MAAPGGDGAFPHPEHAPLGCRTCHAEPPGHDSHAALPCGDCHEVAPGTPVEPVAVEPTARCAACHHEGTAAPCSNCHQRPPGALRAVAVGRSGAGESAALGPRRLPFAHERHEAVACGRCHTEGPRLGAAGSCAGCHDSHHTASATCTACHESWVGRATVHEAARVHQGCGGTGCHQDAAVLALPGTRNVCLTCHRTLEEHEPGGDCQACHLTRIGRGGGP